MGLITIACGAGLPIAAQEGTGGSPPGAAPLPVRVVPGTGLLATDRLEPFEATYEQFGFPVDVRFAREPGSDRWGMTMESAGPTGVAVDRVVHEGDLAFRSRHFGFRGFRDEYVEADLAGDSLVVRRLPRDGAASTVTTMPVDGAFVDGTFLYWALALLPATEGVRYTFPTWDLTEDAARTRDSGVLTMVGTTRYRAGAAGGIEARVFEAEVAGGTLRILVAPHAPFLLRQEMVSAEGDTTVVIEATELRRPVDEAGTRRAVGRASRRFSHAYMSGDTAAIRELYTDDAVLLPPGSRVTGIDRVTRYFSPSSRRTTLTHRMTSESLDITADRIIDVGRWHQTVRDHESGRITRSSDAYTVVWERGWDGRLRIGYDMWHRPDPSDPPSPVTVFPRLGSAASRPVSVLGVESAEEAPLTGRIEVAVGGDGVRQGRQVISGPDDLAIEVRGSWDPEGFTLRLSWTDDVLDVAELDEEDALWERPDGRRRDRMYHYDHVHLRFWMPDRFLGSWIAPNVDRPHQWGRAELESGTTLPLRPSVTATTRTDGGVELSVRYDWSDLGLEPVEGMALDVELVVTDGDLPSAEPLAKDEAVDWLTWRGPIVLGGGGDA